MKKTLILSLIAMMALTVNAQDQKKCTGDKKCKTEKCEKKCCDKEKKCEKKACDKATKASDKAKKTDGQTGATKQESKK